MLIKKVFSLIQRKLRAQKLGIKFNRIADFCLPKKMLIDGVLHPVNILEEKGMNIEFMEILLDDCYRLDDFAKKLVNPQPKILDLGANIGLFAIAARNVFPEATIHAYEPNLNIQENLQTQSQAGDFQVFMEAVGIEDGKISLKINPEASTHTRALISENGDVTMTAFRKVVERLEGEIDLAKIDCEGAEWLLFQDAEPWQKIKNLTIEYHLWQKEQTLEKFRENLENLGFKIYREWHKNKYCGLIFASR